MAEREQLLDQLRALVDGYTETSDPAPLLAPGVPELAKRLVALTGQSEGPDLEATYVLAWLHLYRYGELPKGQDSDDYAAMVALVTHHFIHGGPADFPESVLSRVASLTERTADVELTEALTLQDPELVKRTAELWGRIIVATPLEDPARARRAARVGTVMLALFAHTGAPEHLDGAVGAMQAAASAAVHERPDGDHPDLVKHIVNSAITLLTRFELTGAAEDLEKAEQALGAAMGLARRTSADVRYMTDLGVGFGTEVEWVGTPVDPPDRPHWGRCLAHFGRVMLARFEQTGDLEHLDGALSGFGNALDTVPDDDPARVKLLTDLGHSLLVRHRLSGDPEDLDMAVQALGEAVHGTPSSHPGRNALITDHAAATVTRFEDALRRGDSAEEALGTLVVAVRAVPSGHPNHGDTAIALANTLSDTPLSSANTTVRVKAVRLWRAFAQQVIEGPRNEALTLVHTGLDRVNQYDQAGSRTALDEAVQAFGQAVDAASHGDPNLAWYQTELGMALHTRFDLTAVLDDLDEAARLLRAAVRGTAADHPQRSVILLNLSQALLDLYKRTQDLPGLQEAIRICRAAALAATDDFERAAAWTTLGNSLRARAERTASRSDAEEAVRAAQAAVDALPDDHPQRAETVLNLTAALGTRHHLAARKRSA